MPIQFDAVATGIVTNQDRLPFQAGGDSRLLIIFVVGFSFFGTATLYDSAEGGGHLGGADFLAGDTLPSGATVTALYRLNPPNVQIFLGPDASFEGDAVLFAAISFKDAAQVEPSFDVATGTGDDPSIEIASAVENLVLGLLGIDATSIAGSPGVGETERFDASFPESEFSVSQFTMAGYEQAGTALVTISPTLSSFADWILIGLNLGPSPPLMRVPIVFAIDRRQRVSLPAHLPVERRGALHLASLPIERSSVLRPHGRLPVERRRLPSLDDSSSIVHTRRILSPLDAPILHTRDLIAAAPSLAEIVHTRTILRGLPSITHERTLIPRAVLLQSGVSEEGLSQDGSPDTIILSESASSLDGFYVGMVVTQGGESRRIVTYVGDTRTATVDPPWLTPPISGTPYAIAIAAPSASRVLRPTAEVVET